MSRGKGLTSRSPIKRTRMRRAKPDPLHEEWRQKVLDRDGRRCRWIISLGRQKPGQRCHQRGDSLHAHHINERSQRPDLRYAVDNGATLCDPHHDYAHHTVKGRADAKAQGLLGGETYEAANSIRQPR